MNWLKQEEEYLTNIKGSSLSLSQSFHKVYFRKKKFQSRLRIPAIIVGSFTGVASFGTSTFPKNMQRWVAIIVGLVNIGIAVLNTIESFFKVSEDMTSARNTSEQLRKLAEDIDRELALPQIDRETSGIIFLREAYTRYQQILNQAPMLARYISHADKSSLKFTIPYSNESSRRGTSDEIFKVGTYLKSKTRRQLSTKTKNVEEKEKERQLEPYMIANESKSEDSSHSSGDSNIQYQNEKEKAKQKLKNEIIVRVE